MRLIFRRARYRGIEEDLKLISHVICSSSFVFMDSLIWSVIMASLTFPLHQSLAIFGLVLLSAYSFSCCLFLLLKKWLGDQPD
ncbi:hypothetical protein [Cytobacillus sp. NCCP-133]|uniref:hypothetical protein n=1 Tax=Cytobacillus sp. NCCP-133 TaxID=766848 RepID=UPI00222E7852|nr:hypothetical protein [Cytobacillus sp. NCCP-133]